MDIFAAAEALGNVDLGVDTTNNLLQSNMMIDANNLTNDNNISNNDNNLINNNNNNNLISLNNNNNNDNNNNNKIQEQQLSPTNKKAVVKKLESGGRILSLIKKAEQKKVAKKKIITFLKKKGVSEQKIIEAYQEYYKQERLYEITFNERPLGFSVIMDTRGKNAIVSSIQDENNKKLGMKVASRMYEVNGKRVDGLKHRDILKTISSQSTPFYVVFREARRNNKTLQKLEKEKENAFKWQDEKDNDNNLDNNNNNNNNNKNNDIIDIEDEYEDESSSYSSDDDAAHVANHNKKKKIDKQVKKQKKNGSLGLFKMNEVGYWDDDDVQKEQNEMLKELSRLMMGMAVNAPNDKKEATTVNGMTHKRQKTLKKLLDVSQADEEKTDGSIKKTKKDKQAHDIHSRSMSITQNDINKLMGEDNDGDDEDYDKEIFKHLNDLIDTGGSNGVPMTPTTGKMVNEFFAEHDDNYEDSMSAMSTVNNNNMNNNNDNNNNNNNDKTEDDILESLTQGTTLMKYGKFGKPKYKTFQLTKDKKSLIWFSKKKNLADTTIPIANIRKILIGDQSKDLSKKTKQNIDVINASFTVYYGDHDVKDKDLKKLTVTAKNEKIAFIWANGLKILADAARKGQNLSEIKREDIKTEFKRKELQSKHRKTNSVIISLNNLQKGSSTNLFSSKSTISAQQLLKSHERTKANLNKCVEFVTSKRNWKAITAAGQFDSLKDSMNSLDKRLRTIHKSITLGDKDQYNSLKAELFSVNADIDALKQKLTAIVRKPKEL